jgi:hypothetical protein
MHIEKDGKIIPTTGSNSWVSLDGITFRAGTATIVAKKKVGTVTGTVAKKKVTTGTTTVAKKKATMTGATTTRTTAAKKTAIKKTASTRRRG